MGENALLRVGFGRTDITGNSALPMGGYGDPLQRVSEGVLLPLCATCIAITDAAEETVLLYTLDHLCTNQDWMPDLRSAITAATGVPDRHIMLCATHTHAGPDVRNTIGMDHPYYAYFKAQLVQAAQLAMEDRAESTAHTGDTYVQNLNFVRHYRMADGNMAGDNFGDSSVGVVCNHHPADNQVRLIRFSRPGKSDILLMNFQAHPKLSSTGCSRYGRANRLLMSSDIVGATRAYVEENAPVLVAYYQGAAGNLNPVEPYLTAPGKEKRQSLETYGAALGGAVVEAMDALTPMTAAPVLKVTSDVFETRHKKDGSCLSMELNAISLGDIGFVTAPYEMFDTHGKQIREASPYGTTFVLTYANGRFGYIATEETWNYTTADGRIAWELVLGYVTKGTGEQLVQKFVAMLKGLQD